MCGIAGFWIKKSATEQAQHLLGRMNSCLTHRGPDEDGFFTEGPVGLANRRLSILDLAGGRQPVFNEDRSLVVVYNGEIYNYPELRTELEAKGHRFATRTDTEVLVHLYEEYGADFPARLRGMFAFALYDRQRGELFLARDPLGIKPLVYAELPQGVFFASELRALLTLPFFPREADREALVLYAAFNYIPAPFTAWKAARRLPPGHWLRIRAGRVVEQRAYFEPQPIPTPATPEEAQEVLDAVLRESVRAHLLADVPVGAFLSGGLDSSLVVAMAQQALGSPLQTFTITFPEWPVYDEATYARRVAEVLGTDHTDIPVTAAEAQASLWEAVRHLDEPFADSSLVNVALISKVARRHVKVVLSGDGGDELFAGYNKYQGLALARRLRHWAPLRELRRLPWPERRGTRWGERLRQARKLLRILHHDPFERYLRATLAGDPALPARLLRPEFARSAGGVAQTLAPIWQQAVARYPADPINRWLWSDLHFVLPYDMLRKVDTASMMHSLEVRVPLVDVPLAQVALGLPGAWKLHGWTRKWILRRVAQAYLPPEILDRPKGGFGIPLGEWMRDELREAFAEYLRPAALRDSVWNPRAVERLWREHQTGRRDRFWELWNVFVFEVWRQKWRPSL